MARVFISYRRDDSKAITGRIADRLKIAFGDEHVVVERPQDDAKSKIIPARITDLDNYAMPFIRYENGDVLDFTSTTCDCGRGLATLCKVLGRTHDFLVATDNRPIPGEIIPHAFQKVIGFDRYFVHQKTRRLIEIQIIENEDSSEKEIEELKKVLRGVLGEDMEIEFIQVEHIETPDSGKLIFIKSDIHPTFS